MKTFRLIGMAIMAVMLCFNFTACSSDDGDVPSEPQSPKEYTVSLGFTGEISVSESPLSRASGNDLYGIQVYSCPDLESSTTYTYYAYGLFDDTSLMTIKLLEGYKYKFVATMVVDGKDKIGTIGAGGYQYPFRKSISNSFIYSIDTSLSPHTGVVTTTSGHYNYGNVERYYGETTDYIPQEKGNVTINMIRTVFGVKFITENLTEGTVDIAMTDAPLVSIVYPETEDEDIYSFYNIKQLYTSPENYSETISTIISWTKADGVVVPLGTHDITFKRNKLTTVTIKVADATTENGIGITLESEEMGEGDNLTVENGELIDTTVGTETDTETEE